MSDKKAKKLSSAARNSKKSLVDQSDQKEAIQTEGIPYLKKKRKKGNPANETSTQTSSGTQVQGQSSGLKNSVDAHSPNPAQVKMLSGDKLGGQTPEQKKKPLPLVAPSLNFQILGGQSQQASPSGSPPLTTPTASSGIVVASSSGAGDILDDDEDDKELHISNSGIRRRVTAFRRAMRRARAKSALPTFFVFLDLVYFSVRFTQFITHDTEIIFHPRTRSEAINITLNGSFCGQLHLAQQITWTGLLSWISYALGTVLLILCVVRLSLNLCYAALILKTTSLIMFIVEITFYGLNCLSTKFYIEVSIFLCIHLPVQGLGANMLKPFVMSMKRPSADISHITARSEMYETEFSSGKMVHTRRPSTRDHHDYDPGDHPLSKWPSHRPSHRVIYTIVDK